MDPDGRIPRPELPPDTPHAERWRYTPEARMKPGSILERFLISSFVSPILFREKDIGFGGGLALTDVDFRDQRYREFANILATYSEEGQQAFRINWSRWLNHRELPEGGVLREERGRLFARAGYEKTLTRRFFGFGSRTRKDAETSYTATGGRCPPRAATGSCAPTCTPNTTTSRPAGSRRCRAPTRRPRRSCGLRSPTATASTSCGP
jgi:hypothetical protein